VLARLRRAAVKRPRGSRRAPQTNTRAAPAARKTSAFALGLPPIWIRRAKRLGGYEEVAMSLTAKQCTPCRGGVPPLTRAEAERLLRETPGWTLDADATRIERTFTTADFASALALVEKIAEIAEGEGHHPDICFGWGYCRVVFYTHKIKGLHENDFIMAAKVNALAPRS